MSNTNGSGSASASGSSNINSHWRNGYFLSLCWRIVLVHAILACCWWCTMLTISNHNHSSSLENETSLISSKTPMTHLVQASNTALRGILPTVTISSSASHVTPTHPQGPHVHAQSTSSEGNNNNKKLLVQYGDSIYVKGDWDGAPIVIEEYKLVFFTTAKVACTVWKQLFRRMMGFDDYANYTMEEYDTMIPWNPETNGLKYLYDYSPQQASHMMMTDSQWTRAIFVREPKSRFLSAYLDKAFHETYLKEHCCAYTGSCVEPARSSLDGFLNLMYYCDNSHWKPQSRRMGNKFWPFINYVGHMENIEIDAKQLLTQIGAWDKYGQSGWGPNGNDSIFHDSSKHNTGQHHATNAQLKLQSYFGQASPDLIAKVEAYYAQDYESPYLNLTRIVL